MAGRGRFLGGIVVGTVLTIGLVAAGLYAFGGVVGPLLMKPPAIPAAPTASASDASRQAMAEAKTLTDSDDGEDLDIAQRGFVATRTDPIVRNAKGEVVVDLASYDFLLGPAPETANPSLWRQARILTRHGLFQVADRIWQVRGFDVSVVSFIDAGAGWIVVDPLTTVEAAAAAFDLVKQHLGDKPVLAVIYSHSHADHFGGVQGIVSREDVEAGKVAVIAPDGFLHHAVAENIIAGPAMSRRARFQFGLTLLRGAEGEMTSGLGPGISRGVISMLAPTDVIRATGEQRTIGDLTLVFQVTPGTEAPAEMNFHIPSMRALFMAENANLTMHNLLPARGALVRDAKAWADYLTEAIRLYGAESDTMFAAHGIPRFGQDRIVEFLSRHRDAYKYLHDQSVRLMNAGLTGTEIAEVLKLPEVLARQWYNRGYYGTMSHNSKAVYQRYMGWYDANPANLNPLPPEPAGRLYVDAMGGADAVLARARQAADAGEYRWAAMILNHLVFAQPDNGAARHLLAAVYTQLGFQAEAGTWRNIYLTGAQELRDGVLQMPPATLSPDMLAATPTSMLLDFAAVRLVPDRAAPVTINLVLSDIGERHLIRIANGVMVHEAGIQDAGADATATMARMDMILSLLGGVPPAAIPGISVEGRTDAWSSLTGMMDPLDTNFPIVTP